MIEFSSDYNLTVIRKESKLFNLQTRVNYRIFGLRKGSDNPLIRLEFCLNSPQVYAKTEEVKRFFKENKIEIELLEGESNNKTSIGLRKDLRKHIFLTSGIIQTIIYTLEGRLNLNQHFVLLGVPRFS